MGGKYNYIKIDTGQCNYTQSQGDVTAINAKNGRRKTLTTVFLWRKSKPQGQKMAMAALARRKASSLLLSKNLCSSSDAFKYSLSLSSFSRGFASGSGDNAAAAAAIKKRGTLVGCIPSKVDYACI